VDRRELEQDASWTDSDLVRAGIDAFCELANSGPRAVLLVTNLHAGNVLRAARDLARDRPQAIRRRSGL